MKIDDEIYVHGYIDEIRQGKVIIRNGYGYFGTTAEEVRYADDFVSCKEVDARCDKAYHKGYNKGISEGNINDGTFAEKVNEAYRNGYEKGAKDTTDRYVDDIKQMCKQDKADSEVREKQAYDRGVDDVWKALCTLCGWSNSVRQARFNGDIGLEKIIAHHTAQEVIDIVQNFPNMVAEKHAPFEVGDEVECGEGKLKAVVTRYDKEHKTVEVVDKDGMVHASKNLSWYVVTGKQYDGVAELLKKLRGDEDVRESD